MVCRNLVSGQTAPRTLRWHCCPLASSTQGYSRALLRKAAQTRGWRAELQRLSACPPPHPSPSSQGHPGPAGPVAAGWPYLRPQLEVTVASPCTATPRSTDPLLFQSWGALESPHCSPCFWAAKAPQPRGRGSGAGKPASAPQASIFFGKSIYVQTSSLSQDSVVSAASLHWTRRLRKLKRRVSAALSRGPGSCHQSRCELPSFTGGYTDPKLGNMSERGKSRLS